MNSAHWHLALNHIPVVGVPLALCLVAAALWKRNDVLMRAGLRMLVALALCSVAVYLTGRSAQYVVMDFPEVTPELIDAHEHAATVAFAGVIVTGIAALAGLLVYRRKPEVPRVLGMVVLVLGLAVSAALGWTANAGGCIRHTEIRPAADAKAGKAE